MTKAHSRIPAFNAGHDLDQELKSRLNTAISLECLLPLFSIVPDAFFYVKDKESRFVYLNQPTLEGLGANSASEVLGKTDLDFHPPAMAMAYLEEDRVVLANGPVLHRVWLVHNLRFRLPQWLVSSKVPLRTISGEIVGLAGVMYPMESRELRTKVLRELEPAIRHLETHFHETVCMGELARGVHCSRTQLNRRFQELLHMTPTEFLMSLRVQAARRLLATTDLEIAAIAVEVGFCDQSHLTRRFRIVCGQTPAAFRRGLRESSSA